MTSLRNLTLCVNKQGETQPNNMSKSKKESLTIGK